MTSITANRKQVASPAKPGFLLLLLLPFFLECYNSAAFGIEVPGSPLNLGSLCLVAFGGIMLVMYRPQKSLVFISMLVIFIGGTLGAFFSSDLASNLSNAIGKIVLLFGAWGLAKGIEVHYRKMMRVLDILMASSFCYWVYYVLDKTLFSGNFISYTTLTFSGRAINHHVVGIQISVTAIYLASRLYGTQGLFRNMSFVTLFMAAFCCLLTESRSNTAVVIISFLWLVFQERKIRPAYLFISMGLVYFLYFFASEILTQYNFLQKRFDLENSQYQTESNIGRLFIYQHFPETFLQNPLGIGFEAPRMDIGFMMLNMHNQFLTYILAGGIIALAGVVIFWRKFLQIMGYHRLKTLPEHMRSHTRALTGMSFVFVATLLTVENGGALFLLTLAVIIYLEHQLNACKMLEKRLTLPLR